MTEQISAAACTAFVSALADAAIIIDAARMVIAANEEAERMLAPAAVGKHITYVLRASDVLLAVSESIASGAASQVQANVRGRISRTLDVRIAPLGTGFSGQRLVLLIFKDQTREEQIERMRSDFVANASHELRTPLTALLGFIETMQGAARQDERARGEFLALMKAQADRMAGLIDDLLSLSRIELDEHLAPEGTADLAAIARETAELLRPLAAETGCALIVDMPDALPVRGDASSLAQVMHNLMENALKYSGEGKTARVSGRVEGGIAIVTVADDGPGIAAHHVPRLTERFYRVNVQASRARGGTGLGLAICKHIVNRHRGKLLIESEPGRGSRFSIHLPSIK
jgi:two-component system, OmpR family, phosphate regulon sensor histidine kinase PhoR